MLSNLLIISKDDVLTIDNEGKGYCLILAFFQGLHSDQGRLHDKEKQKLISDAMKLVIDHEEQAREVLSHKSKDIIATWYNKYNNVYQNLPLKQGEFWNFEILEFYIQISNLKVQIYYFREFVANQYVLLKTRANMDRQEDLKVLSLLELSSGHKLLIKEFNDKTNKLENLSVNVLLDNTNFNELINASEECAAYSELTFIPFNICRKVIVTHDATCGYASIAHSIGKSYIYIIEQLSEHYLKEYAESTDSEFFDRGCKLNHWIIANQDQPLPEELSLTFDDGMKI
jgi:hypothetical protein